MGENAFEEINEAWIGPNTGANAGFNFGWPATEGPHSDPRYKTPFHSYPQASGDCAITGGSFYDPATVNFPSEYVGDYFFADYCTGWIKSIDLTSKAVTTFITADSTRDPVDVKIASDGSLYYVGRGSNGGLHRVRYVGGSQPPSIVSHPQGTTSPVGGSATFNVSATGSPPLSYQWQRNSVNIAGATGPSYTVSNVVAGDNGARFRAVITNAYGTATSNQATLTVTTNTPPTAAIGQPAGGAALLGRRDDRVRGLGHGRRRRQPCRERLHLEGRLPPRDAHPPVHPGHARKHGRVVHGARPPDTRRPTSGTGST